MLLQFSACIHGTDLTEQRQIIGLPMLRQHLYKPMLAGMK